MSYIKKPYIYSILTIILVAIILFIFVKKNPAVRNLDEFLKNINKSSRISLIDYIVPELHDDAFLTLLMDENIIKDHKILESQKYEHNVKIKVSLTTEYGSVPVWFILSKISNRWLITQFPKIANIEAAVPLAAKEKSNNYIEYQMDVAGTHLYCVFPSQKSSINIGMPLSLVLIEDYILLYEHMIPLHLNRVMSASPSHIEDSHIGYIPIESSLNIYEIYNNKPVYSKSSILPVGIMDVTLYYPPSSKNKILIGYVNPNRMPNNIIRVVLNNTDFQSLVHQEVRLSSSHGLNIKNIVDDMEFNMEKDQEIVFMNDGENGIQLYSNGNLIASSSNRWYISPRNGGNIILNSIIRAQTQGLSGTPYRGNIEISSNGNGLTIINEVDLEEYLYSVVPSEMPIKFGLESLKVQAVAARAYAVRSLKSKGFASLGAHVDDSTASQMYNNIQEHPIAIQAVDQTRGLVPLYEGEIIDARFFSTSCGYTANFHETWSIEDVFPSTEIPYLSAQPQFEGDAASLYNEENFRAFINQKNLESYDQFSPFFRWSFTMTREQIEAVLNQNIAALQQNQPAFVQTRDNEGAFSQQPIPENLGKLQNITPIKRGQGGNVMELEITTTSGVYRVIKELNIRRLLKPVNLIPGEKPIQILRHDNSIVTDFPILPSSFFYIDIIRDNRGEVSQVIFTGGGYGHGVGMSQYGAYGLSLLGKSYLEIIEHFYPGTKLENLY